MKTLATIPRLILPLLALALRGAETADPGEVAFTLPGMTGIVEGLAWRAHTGEFYFGDVHNRCVWVRAPGGDVRRFTPENEPALLGVFGLAVDEDRRALWAAMSALPEMRGFSPALSSAAGLAEIDVATGAVRRVARVPADGRAHVLGDLTLAPDGTVWVTDSRAPMLWRLAPGATALENFATSADFKSLQGVVVAPGGGALFLTDYSAGLLRLDLATRAVRRLAAPAGETLRGLDGLALAPDGTLLAVQNGLQPPRVLRLTLDATGAAVASVTVFARGHARMTDPTLGGVAAGDFFFVGDAGWPRFEAGGAGETPREVPIFRVKL